MAEANMQEFNTDLITAMDENFNWLDKSSWTSFAAVVNFSISLALIAQEGDDFQDSAYATIVRSASDENGSIYVGKKGKTLMAMFFGETGTVIAQYNTENRDGTYQIYDEITAQGKMTIFIVGDYKERKIIDSFLHLDAEAYGHEYQALTEAVMNNHGGQEVPPPPTNRPRKPEENDKIIRQRVAWGEGYIDDNGEFVEF